MRKTFQQAFQDAIAVGGAEAEAMLERCWPLYHQQKLTAREAIERLDSSLPRDLARRAFLNAPFVDFLLLFLENQLLTQDQCREMREHLHTMIVVYERDQPLWGAEPGPSLFNEEVGGSIQTREQRSASAPSGVEAGTSGEEDQARAELEAFRSEGEGGAGDRTYAQCLVERTLESLYQQAASCAPRYQACATATEATQHIRPPWRRGVVRRLLLSLMTMQRVQLLVAPGGITQTQFDELSEHLRTLDEAYENSIAPEGYPVWQTV